MLTSADARAAVRPTALVAKRQATKKRAQFARDVAVSVGYLSLSHLVLPVVAATVLMSWHESRLAMCLTIPISLAVGVAYGYEQRADPVKVSWQFPNAVQAFGRTLVLVDRDLIVNFRHWRHHRIWLLTAAGAIGTIVAAVAGMLPFAGLVSTVWLWRFLRQLGRGKVVHEPPYSAVRIRTAMYATGLWKADALPPFRHVRPMRSDDYSDTVWISLHGKSYHELLERKNKLVAGFSLREAEVKITHPEDLPADAIRLTFLNGRPRAPKQHWALTAAMES